MGGDAVANAGDVGNYEDTFNMVKQAMDTWGGLDAIVCNAGILRDMALHNLGEADWDAVVRVHLKQCYNLMHHAWPVFRQQAYGRVVMATSGAGLIGNFGQSNYGAAKAGMFGLMNVAKLEGAKYNIMVNLISPVAMTRMTENLMGFAAQDEARKQAMAPEHVAAAVTFMASPQCEQSGMVLEAGGGRYAASFMVRTKGVTIDPTQPKDADWIEANLATLTDMSGGQVMWSIGETRGAHYGRG
jgi:NAD(P)-dependent dehydrogenase (short-subunit alcohol dehydrogenase family)